MSTDQLVSALYEILNAEHTGDPAEAIYAFQDRLVDVIDAVEARGIAA